MGIEIVKDDECCTPRLNNVLGGTLVQYQGHNYIKLDKSKLGEGIHMNWPKGSSILMNPRYGSLRAVNASIRVRVLREFSERTAINSPIQGTAADIIKLAPTQAQQAIGKQTLQTKMVLQIHDELVFETPAAEVEQVTALLEDIMESVLELDVPLLVNNVPLLVNNVLGGTLVQYQGHNYIKLDKSKLGEGIHMNWPKGSSILMNPRYGSLRAVNASIRVRVLRQCENLRAVKVTDPSMLRQFLRDSDHC